MQPPNQRRGARLPFFAQDEAVAYPGLRLVWNLVLLAVVLLFLSRMSRYTAQEALFGHFVAYPMLVLVVASLIQDGYRLSQRRSHPDQTSSPLAPYWGLGAGVAYLAAMVVLGFGIATVAFLTLVPVWLGQPWRHAWRFLLIGLATAALFLFLFQLGSGIVLPAGLWQGGI